tara:strand:- start:74 stop:916 length:843 start_codon:yes stop_codon:yes gene_type:complete
MKKALKYILKTILFLIIWNLQMAVILYFTMEFYGELRPNGSIAIGGITALIISYRLVKKINISKLFSRIKKDIKLEEETTMITTEKRPSIIKKLMSFFKKKYKIIALIIILISGGVTVFQFSDDLIPKAINPPDAFDWSDVNHPTVDMGIVTKSNDGLYYLRSDMSLYTGRTYSKANYFESSINDLFYQETFLNGKKHGVEGIYVLRKGFDYLSYYKNGLKHGKWETWNLEEWSSVVQLTSRVFYENDLKQGEWKEWDNKGNLIKHWIMKDDIPIEKIVN